MAKNRALGKGLSALMGVESAQLNPEEKKTLVELKSIIPGRFQPRRIFSEEKLRELSDSIKLKGVIVPIIVRTPNKEGKHELIAGERRWRASKMAGISEIPVIIKDITDAEASEFALIENIQRRDLTAIEEAEGYQRLIDEFKYTQEALAQMLSKSRSHVANLLRLLSLPAEIKKLVNDGALSMGHARALVNAENAVEIAEEIIKEGLSVRKVERLVNNKTDKNKTSHNIKNLVHKINNDNLAENDNELAVIEKSLSSSLGIDVKIEDAEQGGKIVLHFSNLEQLDTILQKLTI